jgi:hypothetical protein
METCTLPGTRKDYCGAFDSLNAYDVIDTICAEDDKGNLYQVRTGQHTYCPNGCIQGQCLEKGGNIGASCNAELYLESCSSNGDKKVICQDGQIQEADCRSCVDLEDHVVCSSDNE